MADISTSTSKLGTKAQEGLPGLTATELDTLQTTFSSPLDIPESWKAWLISYIEANPPVLPISQIFGFTDFNATSQEVPGPGAQASGSYVDMNDGPGPQLTALPKGRYFIMFGATLSNNASAAENYMSISVNGAAAEDIDSCMFGSVGSTQASVVRGVLKDLAGDSNSIVCKYRQAGGVVFVARRRWLVAVKVANI